LSSRRIGPIRSGSRSVADPVSSMVSHDGSICSSSSRAASSAAKSGRCSWRGETLKLTCGASPCSRHSSSCWAIARITQSRIGSSRLISPAAGMKSSG
jgi:hypothetical protein